MPPPLVGSQNQEPPPPLLEGEEERGDSKRQWWTLSHEVRQTQRTDVKGQTSLARGQEQEVSGL